MRFKARDRSCLYEWHYWFAWFPIFINSVNEWRWLEPIARKYKTLVSIGDVIRYEAPEKVLIKRTNSIRRMNNTFVRGIKAV
jgi:hypothetical protein